MFMTSIFDVINTINLDVYDVDIRRTGGPLTRTVKNRAIELSNANSLGFLLYSVGTLGQQEIRTDRAQECPLYQYSYNLV